MSLRMMKECLVNQHDHDFNTCTIGKNSEGIYILDTSWGVIERDHEGELPFLFKPSNKRVAELASFGAWFSELGSIDTELLGDRDPFPQLIPKD